LKKLARMDLAHTVTGGLPQAEAKGGHMTKDKAVEVCVKAVLKQRGLPVSDWDNYPQQRGMVRDLLTCLEALGLWKETP
jgi:hypothetical protein